MNVKVIKEQEIALALGELEAIEEPETDAQVLHDFFEALAA